VRSTDDEKEGMKAGLAYGTRVAERLRSCTFSGSLAGADAAGQAGSRDCGSLVRIELRVRAGSIEEARYQAHGCPATLASASQVCARVTGRSFLEAASVSKAEICRDLGLVPSKEYTAGVALDALHEALTAALGSPDCEIRPGATAGEVEASDGEESADKAEGCAGVLVGMSGGVDSAVAALLLKEKGLLVVGITLTFWNDPGVADERSCCSPENVRRARRVAHSLGIPHISFDAAEAFFRDVVEYFISEYAAGHTPNPCAKCNSRVRLRVLLEVARRLGLSHVATGHYARLAGSPPRLARGVDPLKDQSYVLAEVSPGILDHMIFPLGEMLKREVRERAARAGLEGHSAPESQEICFVPDDDHRRFLRERLGVLPGDIVDTKGRVLGKHEGTYNFTIGQRKGLRVAAGDPRFVVTIDAPQRRVVIGEAGETEIGAVSATGLMWHRAPSGRPLTVQVRSAGAALPARAMAVTDDKLTVVLAEPAAGVAPGQTAVVYEADRVIVAGTISSTTGGAGGER
jgi:tRNA-specific 2-thiouridylase